MGRPPRELTPSDLSVLDRCCLGDFGETFGIQGRATDESAVDVWAGQEARRVVGFHAAAVPDAGDLGQLGAGLAALGADGGVHLLRLLVARDLARTNRPDRLVSNHAEARLLVQFRYDRLELAEYDLHRLAGFPLGKRLANAGDRLDACSGCSGDLLAHLGVGLSEVLTALAVADDHPSGA